MKKIALIVTLTLVKIFILPEISSAQIIYADSNCLIKYSVVDNEVSLVIENLTKSIIEVDFTLKTGYNADGTENACTNTYMLSRQIQNLPIATLGPYEKEIITLYCSATNYYLKNIKINIL